MSLGINTKPPLGLSSASTNEERCMLIDRPIFIAGLGRSGTTIIHRMLSAHPEVAWLSLLCAKFPNRPYLNRWLMRAIDIPILNLYLKRHFVPLENYGFWDFYFAGFSGPSRDLVASDVSERTRRTLRKAVSQLLTLKRHRLLIKITGLPRISFLHAIFPDAKFVHIVRDGRAVANSRLNTSFWKGWHGLNIWGGQMPEHYRQEWERHRRSFVALAGIEWKTHMDQLEAVKRDFPQIDICQVKYECFCANPISELKRITHHCGLTWDPKFEMAAKAFHVKNENEKWKKDLTEEQEQIIGEVLRSYLIKYGYETCQGLGSTEWRHAPAG
jgi:omega-hydroxy-beta-dihydromenaquinone-9 sulfotransferase